MLFFLRLHGQGCQYLLFSCDCPPFTAPKGIKIPSSKILLPLGIIICGHTHIQHTPICDCCFLGYVKIDKAKVFLNWVQKPSPRERDYHNSLFPLFDYSFI
ncbi:hypothetical protein B5G37_01405 [Pseudoflavonifractor sp. An85]|nr:hypothetical protein B5G37_01405 [Pseudoflavonifractor sp. An85]